MINYTYNILFIEDEIEKWNFLTNQVHYEIDKLEFEFHSTPNIVDGLSFLREYKSTIDAVFIEMNFSKQEKNNISNFILQLKLEFQGLPVFIVCHKDYPENIPAIVELIKVGAVDYFGKSNFNIEYMLFQVKTSIEHSRLNQKNQHLTHSVSNKIKTKPILIIEEESNHSTKLGYFAFELESIFYTSNINEETELRKDAMEWHSEFFNLLYYILDESEGVKLQIKYINKNSEQKTKDDSFVAIILLFSIERITQEEILQKFELLLEDIKVFLQHGFNLNIYPYNFVPLVSESDLRALVIPLLKNKFYISPKQYIPNLNESVGFKNNSNLKKEFYKIPILEYNTDLLSINRFCQILAYQNKHTELQFILTSSKLSMDEILFLKKYKPLVLFESELNDSDKKNLLITIDNLLNHSGKIFKLKIILYTKTSQINEVVKSSIFNMLFKNSANAVIEIANAENESDSNTKKSLIGYYTSNVLITMLRLPIPTFNEQLGIKTNHANHYYLPPSLPEHGTLLGVKNLLEKSHEIRISHKDARLHTYILGQTGTGKSTMLLSMITELMQTGEGVGIIDPHGDLYNKVLERVPEHRKKDIVYFDPADLNNELTLNFIEYDANHPEQKSIIINTLFDVFDELYDMKQTGGPMFFKYFTFAANLAMSSVNCTLVDILRVFQDDEFRNKLVTECTDTIVLNEWKEINNIKEGEVQFKNISPYITSKLNDFLNNSYIRRIVEKPISTIDFRQIIDKKKIFVARLNKGKLSKRGVNLIGTMLFSKFMMAAFSRENISEENRVDFSLMIDEFQNFSSKDLLSAFSEARKYHLNLVVANQSLGQLREDMIQSVMGNVGNLIFFRPGITDANKIFNYFEESYSKEDLINMPNYQCVARIQNNGVPSKPFMFETKVLE